MAGVLTKLQHFVEGYGWEDVKQFCVNNVTTALVFGVSVTAFWLMFRKPRGIPPGPSFTLPIIGDFHRLVGHDDPRIMMRNFRRNFGDIFSFYTGPKIVICLNGYGMIKEALVKNGDKFSDRPPIYINDRLMEHKGIGFSSGQVWKDQRKFALEALREFGFGRFIMEEKILEEVKEFMSVISKHELRPFDMRLLTQAATSNIICSIVYGQRFDYEDATFVKFLELLEENFLLVGSSTLVNFYPFLRFVPGDLFNMKKMVKNFFYIEDTLIKKSIKDHEQNYDENDTRSFIASYLKEMKRLEKTGQKTHINGENLPKTVMDLFAGGSETTSTAVRWTILYLIHHPDIQSKIHKEVQDVVGSGRLPSLKDRDSMPYTQAVLQEILRINNITILGIPHSVKEDTVFRGYLIPKGSMVIPNLDSVLADKDVWGDPDVFRPDRFLDADGKLVKKEEFIPFSIGRRNCLGESLARIELFLFITSLVQRFEFRAVDPKNLPTLKGVFGVTHCPHTYEVVPVPR